MSEPGEAPPRVDQPLIPPFLPRMIHRLALPIVLVWLGIVFVTNTVAPQLEVVSKTHSVSMSPTDAASFQSMMRVGSTFKEFNSDSSAMILLEGDKPLGAEAHRYYDEIVKRLEQDKKHVQHIQDFWSDPLTAAGSQSHDQKAAYVQVYLAGNMGSGQSSESSRWPSARSWTRCPRRRGSRPTSPGRVRCLPTSPTRVRKASRWSL